jgi:hypothetical protein
VMSDLWGKGGPLITVRSASEIEAFLGMVATRPEARGGTHLCMGDLPIRLFRGDRIVAEFSFDHASIVRARSKNIWVGDEKLTPEAGRAMADWLARHGYRSPKDDLDRRDRERAAREAFWASLPPAASELLRQTRTGMVAYSSDIKSDEHKASHPQAFQTLLRELPDEGERARTVCRALGLLDADWVSYEPAEAILIVTASELETDALATLIREAPLGSPELRGAARLVFGLQIRDREPWLKRFRPEALAEILGPIVRQTLRDERAHHTLAMIEILMPVRSDGLEALLMPLAIGAGYLPEPDCELSRPAMPELTAFALMSVRGKADKELAAAVRRRFWKCDANFRSARIAAALFNRRLPTSDDLKSASVLELLITIEALRANPSVEAIDLAVNDLVTQKYWKPRLEAANWLQKLRGQRPFTEVQELQQRQLKAWWTKARPQWSPSGP